MGDDRRKSRRSNRGRGSGSGGMTAQQVLSGFLDRFTSVDELLQQLDQTVSSLDTNVRNLSEALDEQTDLEIEVTQENQSARAYDYSTVVASTTSEASPETVSFNIPSAGTVTKAVVGWPDGAQQAVGVGVKGVDGESLIPAGPSGARYVALNDKVLEFPLNDQVSKGESYTIEFANNDSEQDHFINVLLFFDRGGD